MSNDKRKYNHIIMVCINNKSHNSNYVIFCMLYQSRDFSRSTLMEKVQVPTKVGAT